MHPLAWAEAPVDREGRVLDAGLWSRRMNSLRRRHCMSSSGEVHLLDDPFEDGGQSFEVAR